MEATTARYETDYRPENLPETDYRELFTIRLPALPEQGAEIRSRLIAELEQTLGSARTELFFQFGKESLDHLFDFAGKRERLVTLIRTGDPEHPVSVQATTLFNQPESLSPVTAYWQVGELPDGGLANLENLPAPLQPLATRWFYNDRSR